MKRNILISFFLVITLSATSQVKMVKTDGGLLFTENNKNVLIYQIDRKSIDGRYSRSNYIHPLWGINGTVMTEDFPADHLYQRGVYWAWPRVWRGSDFLGNGWELTDIEQDVVEVEFRAGKNGEAILKTEVLWKSEKYKRLNQQVPFVRENATITIHPENHKFRKIDYEIRLVALEDGIKIGGSEDEKAYGGFSIRMLLPDNVAFSGPDGKITPSETQVESNGYVNISGIFGEKKEKGGIVIADKSTNPDYPQKWVLNSKNNIQNVVFPGEKTITLSTIESIVLNYSLIIYSGSFSGKKIQKAIR